MKTGPNIRKRIDGRFEARYIKDRTENGRIIYGYCYGKTYEEAERKRQLVLEKDEPKPSRVRLMNLLILGAGGQGKVVKEIVEKIGVFNKVAFLDDDESNPLAIGKCSECADFVEEYPIAIPSVGDCALRMEWINMLARAGFIIPTLIDPTATVSSSARIEYGTLVEPKVTIGANTKIDVGCIISSGAIIDRDVVIDKGCHVGCGQIVKKSKI